jgi:hypothetical protein
MASVSGVSWAATDVKSKTGKKPFDVSPFVR